MKEKDDYSELLRDPRWQKRRLEILSRDNWKCQMCGSTDKELHVHHVCYKKGKKPWEYDDRQLVTLCSSCHENEHNLKSWVYTEIDTLQMNGITLGEIYELLLSVSRNIKENPYHIMKICFDVQSTGELCPYVKWLESLADRRMKIVLEKE